VDGWMGGWVMGCGIRRMVFGAAQLLWQEGHAL
jgi:hypothetical protein